MSLLLPTGQGELVLLLLWGWGLLLQPDLCPSFWLLLEHGLPSFFDSTHSWFLYWLRLPSMSRWPPYSTSPKPLALTFTPWLGRFTLTSQRHFKLHRFQTECCLSSSQHLFLFLCSHLREEMQRHSLVLTGGESLPCSVCAENPLTEWAGWSWHSLLLNPRFSQGTIARSRPLLSFLCWE